MPAEVLREHGAVSEPTVRGHGRRLPRRLGTDYALAVSGISGPDGGTPDKPVGTTWVAVATPRAVFARRYRFPADRERNRLLTVAAAVDSLRRVLEFGDGRSRPGGRTMPGAGPHEGVPGCPLRGTVDRCGDHRAGRLAVRSGR